MQEYKVTIWNGEDLMPLAHQWADECGILGFSPEAALRDMESLRERGDSDVFIMLSPEGEVVGGMGIFMLDIFYTDDFHAAVRYWYVKPEHRGVAFKLMAKARRWAIDKGCPRLLVCSNKLCAPADDFYTAIQFEEFETVYVRNV